jgi:hypothetical protein
LAHANVDEYKSETEAGFSTLPSRRSCKLSSS